MNRVRVGILVTSVLVLLPALLWAGDPASALAALKSGNERFVADASSPQPIGHDRRSELAAGQTPFATVLSCADSRVPPELVFDVGLGELFVVRTAGEVLDKSVLASVEYAIEHVHTPLLVVMGHEFCGAVKAATEPTKESLGVNLDFLVNAIRPAVARAADRPEAERMKAAILNNVEDVINNALHGSEIVRRAVDVGTLQIVGAYYELESGRVYFAETLAARTRTATPADHR